MPLTLDRLLGYFRRDLGLDDVSAETELFSSGLLDSFTLVELILFVETEAGFKIPPPDVSFQNLDTPERILAYSLSRGARVEEHVELVEESHAIVDAYSELAEAYDDGGNARSFWDTIARSATDAIEPQRGYRVIADVACGTGTALARLAPRVADGVTLVGIEPAQRMRERALERTAGFPAVRVLDGSFESLPLEDRSVDYLFSHWAFHWTADPERAAAELARVLSERGELDLLFTGRHSGREFTPLISPVYARYLGLDGLLASVKRRRALTADSARTLFARHFAPSRLDVQDVYRTYHDTLEGHWAWWVRIEGHFADIAPEEREACDREVRQALAGLQDERGIPYTMHMVHVRLRGQAVGASAGR